jgi:ubiquinone/menaquinone biosynthesis C-methylase UbiE
MKNNISASQYFNENWKKYQQTIQSNTLYHKEMTATLNTFLNDHFSSKPFSFVDVGCGDSSTIISVLTNQSIQHYIGIDAAEDVLKLAADNLKSIKAKKEFICDNMVNAISQLPPSIDVIYTSYAIHHLSHQQKVDFIQTCQDKLSKNGFLIMIDGILKPNQTRDQWLTALETRMHTTQHLSPEELTFRMQHPRKDDHPESIATFKTIATQQHWKNFQVPLEKDICAFMIFTK